MSRRYPSELEWENPGNTETGYWWTDRTFIERLLLSPIYVALIWYHCLKGTPIIVKLYTGYLDKLRAENSQFP